MWKNKLIFSILLASLLIGTIFLVYSFMNLSEPHPSSDVCIKGNYAYTANKKGMTIFDIENPSQVTQIKQEVFSGSAFGITEQEDFCYSCNFPRMHPISLCLFTDFMMNEEFLIFFTTN